MTALEIKKNTRAIYLIPSVLFLYLVFLLGDCGMVLPGDRSTTVLGAIWNKLHGNLQLCSEASDLLRMWRIWNDNTYLPVLLPFLCGLPSALVYIEEIRTGNKKCILVRSSLKQYYQAKTIANAVSAVVVSALAVVLYYITVFFGLEHLPFSHEEFPIVYSQVTGNGIENAVDISGFVLFLCMAKNLFYFLLYSMMSASFCLWLAVWFRDQYMVFGGSVFLFYLLCRFYDEFARKYVQEGKELLGKAADIINPGFLQFAGRSGFYQDKEWLALGLCIGISVLNYGLAVLLSKKSFDLSER